VVVRGVEVVVVYVGAGVVVGDGVVVVAVQRGDRRRRIWEERREVLRAIVSGLYRIRGN
jgi:hypothetical protein